MRLITKHPTPENVYQHFQKMQEGKVVRLKTRRGYGRREFIKPYRAPTGYLDSSQPKVNLVTPVAMAETQARAKLLVKPRRISKRKPIKRSKKSSTKKRTNKPMKSRVTKKKTLTKTSKKLTIKRKPKKKSKHNSSRAARDNFN